VLPHNRCVGQSVKRTSAAVAGTAALTDAAAAAGSGRGSRGGPGATDPFIGDLRRGGLLPLLVLHFCSAGPTYGNQLIERISDLTAGTVAVNPNTMYPLLRSLEAGGCIVGEWEHPQRRSRRFYRITAQGEAERERLAERVGGRLDAIADGIGRIQRELAEGEAAEGDAGAWQEKAGAASEEATP
jgi:PadR family transcriptional regulator PadR